MGVGAGFAHVNIDDIGGLAEADGSDTVFAAAIEGGSRFPLTDSVDLFTQTQLMLLGDIEGDVPAGSIDLGAALEACGDLFIRHGGHAGAAGFEIDADRWPAFVTRFEALAGDAVPPDPRPILAIDLALPALAIDYPLHRDLAGLVELHGVGQ